MGEQLNKKAIIIKSLMVVIAFFIIIYLLTSVFFQYHFIGGTKINGIDFSYKTAADVKEYIKDSARTYYLDIMERGGITERITSEDIGLSVSINDNIDKLIAEQNSYNWMFEDGKTYTVNTNVTYNTELLNEKLNKLKCLNSSEADNSKGPKLIYNEGSYSIEEKMPKTSLSEDTATNSIITAINNLDKSLNLEDTGCYETSLEDIDNIYGKLTDTLNAYVNVKITLTFDNQIPNKIISCDEISKWLSVDRNLNILIDREGIIEYLREISNDIETMGKRRIFTTSYDKSISVSGGDYGWWISEEAEADAIIADIKGMKDVTREMNFLQRAMAYGENDLGNTYIEIDLTNQHLFCYKEGMLITECDIISGKNTSPTPKGVYRMRFMFTDYTFNRDYFNKTVNYWMVFYGSSANTNIGLMSCDFRDDFGSSSYRYNGTYGSVYLPIYNSKIIYNEIPNEIPVIIY